MSDKLYPLPLRKLLKWILLEEKTGSIFSIPKELFHTPSTNYDFSVNRFNHVLGTPIGVAAGPHTQLSQNIIASYLCGARYLELKTVQTLDEIEVTKPCIDMTDEGYNCEWSQELKTQQSYDEYLNAWILIHVIRDLLGWQDDQHGGFIFNLSVGYDYKGIQNPNVQEFLNKMENCQSELDVKLDAIVDLYPNVKNLSIPSCISNNITLSTMHGCPPDEIEKIGKYLIEIRRYHTAIKLNPTLLGPEHLREILNNELGYDNVFAPDEAFDHDLKYPQALTIINNLTKLSKRAGVSFGLKLTNTLEVNNSGDFLPASEKMSYLSGRALHPISINLAAKLQSEYNGLLDISFCAGADCFNISDIIACDLAPVTVCSDLLKPGGYGRLSQYMETLSGALEKNSVASVSELINGTIANLKTRNNVVKTLQKYSSEVLANPAYQKHNKHFESIKTYRELDLFDCIEAPCIDACAIGQDIPEYLYQASNGNIDAAFNTILKTNPLPGITGNVCDHLCQLKCTRNNYDETLKIREIKRFITENQNNSAALIPKPMNGKKVAIIGAGPSGLTCAYFLALDGFEVEIFESKSATGGMVSGAIPEFRLTDETIKNDLELITALGVKINYSQNVDSGKFTEIQSKFDFIYIAIGAQKNKLLNIPGIDAKGVIEPLDFLSAVRNKKKITLGNKIAVIGGGNTAMDVARTAKRLAGKTSYVTLIYRRTKKEMPADIDEIEAALDEGVILNELVAPVRINTKKGSITSLTCIKMKLGEKGIDGRRQFIPIKDSQFEISMENVIPAIGQDIVLDFLPLSQLVVDPVTFDTQIQNVFAGGDAIRGASSVIKAAGDGQRVAKRIIAIFQNHNTEKNVQTRRRSIRDSQIKYARRAFSPYKSGSHSRTELDFQLIPEPLPVKESMQEADRCLHCDDICSVCTTVCPNFANIYYPSKKHQYTIQSIIPDNGTYKILNDSLFSISQDIQIINIGDFCNECGNCTTFCPTSGDPYKDKPRFYLTEESFNSESEGYYFNSNILYRKVDGIAMSLRIKNDDLFKFQSDSFDADIERNSGKIINLVPKKDIIQKANTKNIVVMAALLENIKDYIPFNID